MMRCTKTVLWLGLALLAPVGWAQTDYDLAKLESLALQSSRAVLAGRSAVDAARAAGYRRISGFSGRRRYDIPL